MWYWKAIKQNIQKILKSVIVFDIIIYGIG